MPRPNGEMKTKITVSEIAARLGIGTPSVYALLEQGKIPAIRIGRNWLVTRPALEEWERTCGVAKPERPNGKQQ